jgi:DNA-binding LacI/PurR family transcriptional regulator
MSRPKKVRDSGQKATIVDLSRHTGYSIATVSRALNNFVNVKESTKKKILDLAKTMNYVPNVAAKNLVKGRSKIIGLVLPDRSGIYNDFINHFTLALHQFQYNLVIYNSNNESTKQAFNLEQLLMQQVDGIIFSPIPGDYKALDRVLPMNIPVVLLNRYSSEHTVDHVLFDFRKGMSEAVDYLVSRGRRHFYHFARQDVYRGTERRNTFNFALKVNSLPVRDDVTFPVDDDYVSGFNQMKALLETGKEVDVVFCSSDFSAVGAIRAALDAGKRIPQDIAVVGSYDTPIARYGNPRLSTIQADFNSISTWVAGRILRRINEGPLPFANFSVPTTFVHRETT